MVSHSLSQSKYHFQIGRLSSLRQGIDSMIASCIGSQKLSGPTGTCCRRGMWGNRIVLIVRCWFVKFLR
ncbi:predicted protein [Arabidopsis lyrata subsp. lyrata]|uniref:Predicted protein n=1 Tax=Arabidopsis lyrata subsp. lyrata TaxID=81972 RepID=D7KX54_ARALL|nr:predicted protein [Arabidopsis lyrata subsp. lyrata]